MISRQGNLLTDETKAKLTKFWRNIKYLVLDECSMLSKTFLATLSRRIAIGKQKEDGTTCSESFGCALYHPVNMVKDSAEAQLGRTIYEEFSQVVLLKEQVRVTDEIWHEFLCHLRDGHVQENHLPMLKKLDAVLVTPRHSVRNHWNRYALCKHCKDSGQRLFKCSAEDTIGRKPLSDQERTLVQQRAARQKHKRNNQITLADEIELAIGMKVMVTDNIETDLDITNGARGEIVDIILDPREAALPEGCEVKLRYLPSYILVKLTRTRATRLEGLGENVVPIQVKKRSFKISYRSEEGKTLTRTVQRRQYAISRVSVPQMHL
ncbi:hypothetical protein WOLCODRAFT_111000 [Wolfiporia cocos MD-104 SS10]|uniref:ATP-dependent DNA helicase n=1 Tax=Wolfiporia cocos (strain MD-104) TaxID=742152 RepID=A0A2H3JUB4_WOLCO|nr:hypothetical protein WOLCODRAFT_111000 [Wolfiporia cocos MD-104 SS10]